jgi:quercetin dioxygenase-like cupin family protein
MSAFGDTASIPPQQIWDGIVARAVHGDLVTLSLIELDPATVVPEHAHENEQLGILLQGTLTFRIGDETRELRPGGTWCIRAFVPHGVTVGPAGAQLIEVFSPARSDWEAIEGQTPRPPLWPTAS